MQAAGKMLDGFRCAPACLGRVAVFGLGVSGSAVVAYLRSAAVVERVQALVVFAGAASPDDAAVAALVADGVDVRFGECVSGTFDVGIVSPGIPETGAFYKEAAAACGELISEVEFAWRESSVHSKWVAVTGTNGKTTTTALLGSLLSGSLVCGNIGAACIAAVGAAAGAPAVFVVEVSSYQLASIRQFAPDVAVFLGITPDHLSWHGSFEAYAAAKWCMLSNMERAGGVAILDATNSVVREQVRRLRHASSPEGFTYIPLGTKAGIGGDMRAACGAKNAAFVAEDGTLHVAFRGLDHALCKAEHLSLKGAHNVVNALAASAAAGALGVSAADVSQGLAAFQALEHRIEPVGDVGGVQFYNDSKATNVDATLVAVASFEPGRVVVMLGGRDKMGPVDALVSACEAYAKAVVVFGEAAERFEAAFRDAGLARSARVVRCETFDEAFVAACELAGAGDVVLLSPACASFDEFSCFEERGTHFKELVFARARSALEAN